MSEKVEVAVTNKVEIHEVEGGLAFVLYTDKKSGEQKRVACTSLVAVNKLMESLLSFEKKVRAPRKPKDEAPKKAK